LESQRGTKTYAASCITIAELYENMSRQIGKDVVKLRISSAKDSGIAFVPLNEQIAEQAGDLKLVSGEIPVADAIIAATAQLLTRGQLLSDDDHFKKIKNLKISWVD
jgi:predicted nucleic acid-binding protein